MLVVGTFEHSIELEQALAEVQRLGVPRERILVVLMEPGEGVTNEDIRAKAVEAGIASATGFAAVGACIGFMLAWGPIVWGLVGYLIGYSLYRTVKRANNPSAFHPPAAMLRPDVTVVIQCEEELSKRVSEKLNEYRAITVGFASELGVAQ